MSENERRGHQIFRALTFCDYSIFTVYSFKIVDFLQIWNHNGSNMVPN